jgi:hypothetical protein
MWHCNATGVYSGIVANGNGDSSDESNLDNTFLRGIQKTDSDGVAQFESIFPGHYTSRATHIHVLVHTNATLYSNGTLGNDVVASHVGQAFFDQDLITEVEKLEPYSTNTQEVTNNEDDQILSQEAATEGSDPVMSWTLLGDDLSDGLFAWLAFGINTTQATTVTPAAYYYAEGGVENENAGSGMGGGDGMGGGPPDGFNGTAPPGMGGSNTSSAVSAALSAPTTASNATLASGASVTFKTIPALEFLVSGALCLAFL